MELFENNFENGFSLQLISKVSLFKTFKNANNRSFFHSHCFLYDRTWGHCFF